MLLFCTLKSVALRIKCKKCHSDFKGVITIFLIIPLPLPSDKDRILPTRYTKITVISS